MQNDGPWHEIDVAHLFLHPRLSMPLEGYDEVEVVKGSEVFLKSVETVTNSWWKKFPECCNEHRRLQSVYPDIKQSFEFIPQMIVDSAKYFLHAIEIFFQKESWYDDITEYYDYLDHNFGSPSIGGHIFNQCVESILFHATVECRSIEDSEREILLDYAFPNKDVIESTIPPDLNKLHNVFQDWLRIMPSFGVFINLKKKLEGKSPMQFFIVKPKYNRYLGISKFKTKSPDELVSDLQNYTIDLLKSVNSDIEVSGKDALIIKLAEERLRISHESLFNPDNMLSKTSDIVLQWMNSWIEYFQIVNSVESERNIQHLGLTNEQIKESVDDVLSIVDIVRLELSALNIKPSSVTKVSEYCNSDIFRHLSAEIEMLSEEEAKNLLVQIKNKSSLMSQPPSKQRKRSSVGVKHRIRVSIPLFIGVTGMSEIEVSNIQDFPRNLKELRELLAEE